MNQIKKDCFTGDTLNAKNVKPFTGESFYHYYHPTVGEVKISWEAYGTIYEGGTTEERKHLISGICRNLYESQREPVMVWTKNLSMDLEELKEYFKLTIPKTFKEKWEHLLNFMASKGGLNYEKFSFDPYMDYPITFGDNAEFERVIEFLEDREFIKVGNLIRTKDGKNYSDVVLTNKGESYIQEGESIKHRIQVPKGLKKKLIQLFKDDDIDELLDQLEEFFQESDNPEGWEFLMLKRSHLSSLQKKERQNLISENDFRVEVTKLKMSILKILE